MENSSEPIPPAQPSVDKGGAPKGNGNARKHGLSTLKKAWSQLGSRVLDGRSQASVAIRKWRAELIADLGGEEAVSTQQLAIVDLCGKQKIFSIASTPGYSVSRHSSMPASDHFCR
jgi:hypothetical protein